MKKKRRRGQLTGPGEDEMLHFEAESIVQRSVSKTPEFQKQIQRTTKMLIDARKETDKAVRAHKKK